MLLLFIVTDLLVIVIDLLFIDVDGFCAFLSVLLHHGDLFVVGGKITFELLRHDGISQAHHLIVVFAVSAVDRKVK